MIEINDLKTYFKEAKVLCNYFITVPGDSPWSHGQHPNSIFYFTPDTMYYVSNYCYHVSIPCCGMSHACNISK